MSNLDTRMSSLDIRMSRLDIRVSKVILESGKTKTAKNSRLCVAFRMFFFVIFLDPLVKKLDMNMYVQPKARGWTYLCPSWTYVCPGWTYVCPFQQC